MAKTVLYISYNGITEPLVRSQVLNYLEGLVTEGYRFVLLTFEKTRLSNEVAEGLRKELSGKGITWFNLPYHHKPQLLGTAWDVSAGARLAVQLARKYDVCLVHARSFVPALIARKVKERIGVPFINDIRGFWVDEKAYKGSLRKSSVPFKWGKQLEQKVYLSSDAVVSLSDAGLDEIRSWSWWQGRELPPMQTIPTCVDLGAFTVKKDLNAIAPVFGYVGSLGRGYLGREVFRFFKVALQKLPGSRFLVVSRTDRQLLDQWRNESGLGSALIEIISANPDQVAGLLNQMDVGLSFIEAHYSKKASCPTKLGEYLAGGIPVIANRGIGDTDSILTKSNTGVLLDQFTKDNISLTLDKVFDLMKDVNLPQRCRATAENIFSLDKGITAYSNLYCDILR